MIIKFCYKLFIIIFRISFNCYRPKKPTKRQYTEKDKKNEDQHEEGILSKNNHKNVTIKRHNFTKSERECIKGIIHNLSFQRLTDQEIVQWLHDEKQIDIDRSTVFKMRKQGELEAEKWYIELKKSTYKCIAIYKERIHSLFSYQRILHELLVK